MIKEIEQSVILGATQTKQFIELAQELGDTVDSVQTHRTRTEMEVSVLNDLHYPTPASKYWQSIREQNVMLQGVVSLSFDYREAVVNVKILERDISEESGNLEQELLVIKQERLMYQMKEMKRVARHKVREILEWSDIKYGVAKRMTDVELADVDNHQLISYTQRWINQAMLLTPETGIAERQNLVGQLKSGMKTCKEKGVLSETLLPYDKNTQDGLRRLVWDGQ